MHEYSVVSEILSSLETHLTEHPGRVTVVYLKKGALRILSDHALRNAFEVLARQTRFEGATLDVETIEATIRCSSCGFAGRAEAVSDETFHFAVPVLTCPRCSSEVEMVTGRELYVDRVTVESPSPE